MNDRDKQAEQVELSQKHRWQCVPWRGAGGEIGACIYCGRKIDAITEYYTDRANGSHAAKAAG